MMRKSWIERIGKYVSLAIFVLVLFLGQSIFAVEEITIPDSGKITLIELGSVRCIPCKMMQPVIEEIKEEYKGRVEVIFYDVWTKEGREYGKKYNVIAIPTQVFLDKDGKEYFRHQGFFPKEEIKEILKQGGVKE